MQPAKEPHVVTGTFGYSGKYIARGLLESGKCLRTLTNSPRRRNPFSGAVEAHLYHFDHLDQLVRSLEGAVVLYNTYWARFDHRDFTHTQAAKNTLALFDAARRAGVRRVVHVSITHPFLDSPPALFSRQGAAGDRPQRVRVILRCSAPHRAVRRGGRHRHQ